MPFLVTNPTYREYLDRQGLTEPGRFLALPGVIVTGHPQRHVLQLTLGDGPSSLVAFLKKEHRVCWKDRLASAWAGFGLVSKSCREATILQALARADVGCPEWIAAGEDGTGQAFLLLRDVADGVDLRRFLQQPLPPAERRRWARRLGENLARLHAAGFNHPDLYSKHVLVQPESGRFSFLDWQRSRQWRSLSWRRRGRDLAALNATLADDLASARERLVCFRAYCRAAGFGKSPTRQRLGQFILRHSERLLKRRRIREMRQPPLRTGAQSLIWLEGEALCVTPEFHALLRGQVPSWLRSPFPTRRAGGVSPLSGGGGGGGGGGAPGGGPPPPPPRAGGGGGGGVPPRGGAPPRGHPPPRSETGRVLRSAVSLPDGRTARLVSRLVDRPLICLTRLLGRRPPPSPELEQVGLLYRLQRYGLATPKLLAFGQYTLRGYTESFLLTEPLPEDAGFFDWLADRAHRPAERWHLIREAAIVLQVIHTAGYGLDPAGGDPGTQLCVCRAADGGVMVGLSHVEGLRRRGRSVSAIRDLARLFQALPAGLGGRTEALRFLLAYLGQGRLTAAAKRTARLILPRTPSPQQVTLWTSPCAMRVSCPPAAVARHTLPI